jgi:type I restriction enzyme S subunit
MLEFSDEVIANHIGVISGFAFASEYFSNENGTPLIRIRNLLQHKTETFYRASFDIDYMVNNGDILIGMDGDFNVVRWRGEPGLLNQRICKISSKSDLLNEKYLFHWLQPKIDEIHRKTPQTTVKHLSTKDVEHISIPFFPLNEQRRIAEILDTIDEAIQKTEALISKLKAMKQGLLHDLLTRGLDKNGKLRDPKAHPEQFKDSPLGRIPKEWEILSVKDSASVKGGKRLPKRHLYSESPTKYRYLRVLDFFEREIDYNSLQYLKEETFETLERYEIQERDIFISIAGSIGYAGAFNPQIKDRVILTENAARLVINDKFRSDYLAFQLNSGIVQDQILKEIGTGGGVPKLALHRIENLKVICPVLNEQMKVVDILNIHDARIRTEEQYHNKLKLQKKGIMHDLLTGKVRVRT